MDLFYQYMLFLVKIVTIVISVSVIAIILVNIMQRKKERTGKLQVVHLNERYREIKNEMILASLSQNEQKFWQKIEKKKQKKKIKTEKNHVKKGLLQKNNQPTLYVLDFKGSSDAEEVASLREEISAVIAVICSQDEVLLRLESPGGVVHGYGLAASQLQRLRERNIQLTVVVDKIATSGGYMMACVANRIVAAPFSIIGSIGVAAQIPNFNRFLKRNDIDIELHTAGEYKRTLTLFGENTDQGRNKFCENLNETHQLFKAFVQRMRPEIDIDRIATGEYWYGSQALEKKLVDSLGTSDDLLISSMEQFRIINVRYIRRKNIVDRLVRNTIANILNILNADALLSANRIFSSKK